MLDSVVLFRPNLEAEAGQACSSAATGTCVGARSGAAGSGGLPRLLSRNQQKPVNDSRGAFQFDLVVANLGCDGHATDSRYVVKPFHLRLSLLYLHCHLEDKLNRLADQPFKKVFERLEI